MSSSLQHHQNLDLESTISDVAAAAVTGAEQPNSETVPIEENNGGNNKKIIDEKRRESESADASECCLEIADVEVESRAHDQDILGKSVRDCRICQLSVDSTNQDYGAPIELGCSCKDDLAAAHKHCAEAWFKIRGNKTCEICGSIAQNVVGVTEAEQVTEHNDTNDSAAAPTSIHMSEPRNFWQGRRFLNFLLACMVFVFVISWLFHFNVSS